MKGKKMYDGRASKKFLYAFAVTNLFSGFVCLIISGVIAKDGYGHNTMLFFFLLGMSYWVGAPLMIMGIAKEISCLLRWVSAIYGFLAVLAIVNICFAEHRVWSDMVPIIEEFLYDSLWNTTNINIIENIQSKHKCCGVNGIWDWRTQLTYYQKILPNSCCLNDFECEEINTLRHKKPCLEIYHSIMVKSRIFFIVLSSFLILNNVVISLLFLMRASRIDKEAQKMIALKTAKFMEMDTDLVEDELDLSEFDDDKKARNNRLQFERDIINTINNKKKKTRVQQTKELMKIKKQKIKENIKKIKEVEKRKIEEKKKQEQLKKKINNPEIKVITKSDKDVNVKNKEIRANDIGKESIKVREKSYIASRLESRVVERSEEFREDKKKNEIIEREETPDYKNQRYNKIKLNIAKHKKSELLRRYKENREEKGKSQKNLNLKKDQSRKIDVEIKTKK